MKRTSNCLTRFSYALSFAAGFITSTTEARSEPAEFPGGFELNSSFEGAQRYARSRGWDLVRLSPELPGQWKVAGDTGAEVGLFVCDESVNSVHQYKPGDLDEFARIVTDLKVARRQMDPSTQVVTFASGATQISNIDVTFAEWDGHRVNVQLSSIAGRLGISTNYFIEGGCSKP